MKQAKLLEILENRKTVSKEMKIKMYKLVNNKEYDHKGVYYGGLNKKYSDLFNITIKNCAKTYENIEEARTDKEMLEKRFGFKCFEIETVKQIVE